MPEHIKETIATSMAAAGESMKTADEAMKLAEETLKTVDVAGISKELIIAGISNEVHSMRK